MQNIRTVKHMPGDAFALFPGRYSRKTLVQSNLFTDSEVPRRELGNIGRFRRAMKCGI